MADFPVPTQDVTGDDKQGMKRMRFLPLGIFYLHFFIHFSWKGWLLEHMRTVLSAGMPLSGLNSSNCCPETIVHKVVTRA